MNIANFPLSRDANPSDGIYVTRVFRVAHELVVIKDGKIISAGSCATAADAEDCAAHLSEAHDLDIFP